MLHYVIFTERILSDKLILIDLMSLFLKKQIRMID